MRIYIRISATDQFSRQYNSLRKKSARGVRQLSAITAEFSSNKSEASRAIVLGGLMAGVLDISADGGGRRELRRRCRACEQQQAERCCRRPDQELLLTCSRHVCPLTDSSDMLVFATKTAFVVA